MRYGTWNILFTPDPSEGGTTPLRLLGIFRCDGLETHLAGYIPVDEDISLLSQWGVVEITEAAFLALALAANPSVTMVDGLLVIPLSPLS